MKKINLFRSSPGSSVYSNELSTFQISTIRDANATKLVDHYFTVLNAVSALIEEVFL